MRSYKIGVEHVVILRNMVARHLTVPHEFVCVCDTEDKARDLDQFGIRALPLDMTKHVPGTCFVRLMLRHPMMGAFLGRRVLNLDVDICIVGNIDHIANRHEENVWWENPNFKPGNRRAPIQTSIQLLTTGTLTHLWSEFDPKITPQWVNRRYGGAEQAWVSEMLNAGPNVRTLDQSDGIYGAMRVFRGEEGEGVNGQLPANASIVSFPGDRAPWQSEVQEQFPWLKEHYR